MYYKVCFRKHICNFRDQAMDHYNAKFRKKTSLETQLALDT